MQNTVDWPLYQRSDNQVVIEFLSCLAAAMADLDILSPKDSEDLRLCIRGMRKDGWDSTSALTAFAEEKSEFLAMLTARFGHLGLHANLFRLTARSHLSQMTKILSELGSGLLDKSQLHFNRGFYIYAGNQCDKKTLFSSLIVELAQSIAEGTALVESCVADTFAMLPSNLPAPSALDHDLDKKIAEYLGFKEVRSEAIPLLTETRIRRRIANALNLITDALGETLEQLQANFPNMSIAALETMSQWLKAEAARLTSLNFPKSGNLEAWELRRHTFNTSIMALGRSLGQLEEELLNVMSLKESQEICAFPQATRRQLVLSLMQAGASAKISETAVARLISYCTEQKASPEQLLPAELARIDGALTPDILRLFQEIAIDKSLSNRAGSEKARTLEQSHHLGKYFQASLKACGKVLTLLMVGFFVGCGVKTAPRSDLEDFRPEIPFRSSPKSLRKVPQQPAQPPADDKEQEKSE